MFNYLNYILKLSLVVLYQCFDAREWAAVPVEQLLRNSERFLRLAQPGVAPEN